MGEDEKQKLDAFGMLNKLIEEGKTPDFVSMEYNNAGVITTTFRWKSGTLLSMGFHPTVHRLVIARFTDFWGSCLPWNELKIKDIDVGDKPGP